MERQPNREFGQGEVDVAILLHDLTVTGVARNALAIADASHRAGLRTEIWVVDGTGQLVAPLPDGVKLIVVGGGNARWKNRRLADLAVIGALARTIRQRRPAIAFSTGNHFHITSSAAYFLAGSPVSVGLLFRVSNPPFRGRSLRIGAVLAWFYRLRFSGARRIISVSGELHEILVKDIRLDSDRVVTIPNSIDLELAKQLAAQAPGHPWFDKGEPPVILGIGRLAPQKNFSLLITAFARLRQTRPARLVIIGHGAGAELTRLTALVVRLGLEADDVWFAGHQPNPLKFLAHAGLFVLSSNWEGMSNVLLEAMACGCPIIATDCPTGVRELVGEERIGTVVPVGDVTAMVQAMLAKLEEIPDREAIIAKVGRHDRKAALGRYIGVFREEIERTKTLEYLHHSK
ncbi:MAG: glycosyltransferase [Aestuariivirga sp.]